MTFPETPRDVRIEMYLGDGWRDVTSDVLGADGVRITRGRHSEGSSPQPSNATWTLKDPNGDYAAHNPTGAYYGSIGQHTPTRVSVRTDQDTFDRDVDDGWGSTDRGNTWTTGVGLGNVTASDWQVSTGGGGSGSGVNLCPNPSGANGVSDWFTNLSLTHVSSGLLALGFARDTGAQITGDGTGEDWIVPAPGAATPGQDYAPSVAVRVDQEATVRLYLLWLDSSLAVIGFETAADAELDADTTTTLAVTGTAPAGAAWHAVQVTLLSSTATMTVSNCMMPKGGTPQPYADGDSPGWEWDGTPGASTSSQQGPVPAGAHHLVNPDPGNAGYRLSYLADVQYRDVEVSVTAELAEAPTGGDIEPANLMLRGQSITDYYLVRVVVTADQEVTVGLRHSNDTVIATAVDTGITYTGQALRVRAAVEGQTVRAKVWEADQGEPYAWQVTGHSDLINVAGWVGVRTGVAASNANDRPIDVTYTNWEVRVPRHQGEAASINPGRDTTGRHRTQRVESSGVRRRLGQGDPPVLSSLRRGLLSLGDDLVAYWPCEDGQGATMIAPGMPGVAPMQVHLAEPRFAADRDSFACSDPLPQPGDSTWTARVPFHELDGERCQVRFLMAVPEGGIAEQDVFFLRTTGSLHIWIVRVFADGSMSLRVYAPDGTLVHDTSAIAFNMNGSPRWVSVEFQQVGSDVGCNLVTVEPGAGIGGQLPFDLQEISSETVGIATDVQVGAIGNVTVGHISVHKVWTSLFALGQQLAAWDGERAGRRIERLCAEAGVPFEHVGDLDDTTTLGPQRSGTLLASIDAAAEADHGELYEPRSALGIAYRTRSSLYNQSPLLTLDFAAGHVAPPFGPSDDDALIRNDVTVTREGGSSGRVVVETGRLSALPVEEGGVGRYAHSATLDLASDGQVIDHAGWMAHLGTVWEPRIPDLRVNLANPEVVASVLEPQVLDVNVGDRVVVENPPPEYGPDPISQLAIGSVETISTYEHTISLSCVPESPYQVIEIGDDGVSRVDSETSVIADSGGIDDETTTIQVASDPPHWVTDAGELPLYIRVGGEDMQVTAITGTSSPQTFTVVRGVNGVRKAHPEGAPVVLSPAHHRTTLAL